MSTLPSNENNAKRDSAACEQAWHSFANREPAPDHKDCFRGGWVAGKGYARDSDAHETLPPRITIMDDGRAMGGSDVCHTCEAHCTVINDLQTGLQKIIREGDYTAPEGMKRIAREALGLPQDAEPWRNCQMLACKPNRRCMNSDDCNTLKAGEQ